MPWYLAISTDPFFWIFWIVFGGACVSQYYLWRALRDVDYYYTHYRQQKKIAAEQHAAAIKYHGHAKRYYEYIMSQPNGWQLFVKWAVLPREDEIILLDYKEIQDEDAREAKVSAPPAPPQPSAPVTAEALKAALDAAHKARKKERVA